MRLSNEAELTFRFPIPSLFCFCRLPSVAAVLPPPAASSVSSLSFLCCSVVWRGALHARPASPFRFLDFSLLPSLFCLFVMKRVMLVCSVLSRLRPCFSLASLLVFCLFVRARCHCFVILSQCAVVFLSCCAARFLRLCSCSSSSSFSGSLLGCLVLSLSCVSAPSCSLFRCFLSRVPRISLSCSVSACSVLVVLWFGVSCSPSVVVVGASALRFPVFRTAHSGPCVFHIPLSLS